MHFSEGKTELFPLGERGKDYKPFLFLPTPNKTSPTYVKCVKSKHTSGRGSG
jgi:hypothetical protein